ncbi:MAG TPA: TIGR03118 family protein [Terriglobales bacterium]|nr:TIGR03118 family protein [Terriglobales bacterium]
MQISKQPRRIFTAILFAVTILLLTAPAFAQHYTRTDLTVDVSATSPTAPNHDPNLVNAWGLSRSSTSPWWVSDNGQGLSTLYNGSGVPQPLMVTIPLPAGASGNAAPTGTAFNFTSAFQVGPGAKAIFLFVTEDGTISGWNPGVDGTHAILKVPQNGQAPTAIYKGVAIAMTAQGPRLYATDFVSGRVQVFDGNFNPVPTEEWAFRDPILKKDFVPFNIQNIGGNLFVTFASRQKGSTDEDHGPGLGAAAVFDTEGRLLMRFEQGTWFNAPWGVAQAPADFGVFAHRILIGNFGDGTINAFNVVTGKHEGTLLDASGNLLTIDGLWALSFGNDANAGAALKLFFTAGPNDESNGLLGNITPVASESRGNTE